MGAFDEFGALRPYRVWPGVVARALNGERLTMALVELEPNKPVPEHHHENEQMGFVVRGEMDMKVGDESRHLTAGQTYNIPSNTPHSVTTGPDGCLVVDIFAPIRSDWEKLDRDEPSQGSWPPG